ncbi:MAG TPA: hypothetical protein VMS77_09490 [Conexivisphaerales archaeon]|nr:hypothetical protein [Conexivisphaerales archaeon]
MSQYISDLVRIANEMPALQYEIEHASNPLSMMFAAGKLCQHVTYILHHVIHDYYQRCGATALQPPQRVAAPAAPPPPAPPARPKDHVCAPVLVAPQLAPARPAPPPATTSMPIALPYLPPPVAPPAPPTVASPSPMADVPITPGVTNVIITPNGTMVTTPGGTQSRLPPGAPVTLEIASDVPAVPPPAPEGYAQVVLPRGGSMPPDLAAALAARSNDEPLPPPATDSPDVPAA